MTTIINNLKIQLDNLCQFLPQDRVSDFARMTPIEMLEATQKTVGTPEMLEAHALLKEIGKEFLAIKKELSLK